jgi:small ligand-binding sensory domain FIST
MAPFSSGHAAHPDWRFALALAAAQIDAQRTAAEPTIGVAYFTDHYAAQADALADALRTRWPGVHWVGCVGVGVMADGVEYFDEPALSLLLAPLPPARFRLFSGTAPLPAGFAHSALVHADPATPDLGELLHELADRTAAGYLFGGLAAARGPACHLADGVRRGGLSGVAFDAGIALVSRVTQGCQPCGPAHRVTAARDNVVLELDGRPAWPCLLDDLQLGPATDRPRLVAQLRRTLAGLADAAADPLARGGQFGTDTRVRHLVGADPAQGAVALGDRVEAGMQLVFCRRDAEAAKRDLVRICSEIRDELAGDEPGGSGRRIAGAIYVSCSGRGGPHFGAPSAEARIVQRALGDVPLAGFFAGGEIAHRHLYGYTGVLTVFADG